jgi:hypothetical protein
MAGAWCLGGGGWGCSWLCITGGGCPLQNWWWCGEGPIRSGFPLLLRPPSPTTNPRDHHHAAGHQRSPLKSPSYVRAPSSTHFVDPAVMSKTKSPVSAGVAPLDPSGSRTLSVAPMQPLRLVWCLGQAPVRGRGSGAQGHDVLLWKFRATCPPTAHVPLVWTGRPILSRCPMICVAVPAEAPLHRATPPCYPCSVPRGAHQQSPQDPVPTVGRKPAGARGGALPYPHLLRGQRVWR